MASDGVTLLFGEVEEIKEADGRTLSNSSATRPYSFHSFISLIRCRLYGHHPIRNLFLTQI
jgi:hypothetical protein